MAKLDPMDADDRRVQQADGTWSKRAYNAYERELIDKGKMMAARTNWDKRHGLTNC